MLIVILTLAVATIVVVIVILSLNVIVNAILSHIVTVAPMCIAALNFPATGTLTLTVIVTLTFLVTLMFIAVVIPSSASLQLQTCA